MQRQLRGRPTGPQGHAEHRALPETGRGLRRAVGVPVYIDDCSALSPLELRAKARRLKNLYGIQAIVVDDLQLMHLGLGGAESSQQEISTISRYLKGLARELNVPVMVLSQLNRASKAAKATGPG